MKYIIDLDALKECLDLLPNPMICDDNECVYLIDVKEMINRFPKEEVKDKETVYR